MAEYDERTERATPRRRQKAREQGKIPRSREFASLAAAGGSVLVLSMAGAHGVEKLMNSTRNMLGFQYGREPFSVLRTASVETMLVVFPFLGAALSFAIAANLLQGGFVLKRLEFQLDKLNPLNGLKRIFSVNGTVEALKSFLKFFAGGYLLYLVMKKDLPAFPRLMTMGLRDLSHESARLIMNAVLYGFFCFFLFGIIDFFVERWRFEKSIKMSREEIKEEYKETEGNPIYKSRLKARQRELARRRMMREVPKATVVITNPTHLAVALRYESGKMAAPRVIAKGAGPVAEKIKEIARGCNIPIVEEKPLARLLFKLKLDSDIPADLYKAVAKILAYIYRLKGPAA